MRTLLCKAGLPAHDRTDTSCRSSRAWILVALLFVPASALASSIERFQSYVRTTQAARSDFEQKGYYRNQKLVQESKGSFAFLRPGCFRWTYAKPHPQLIVGDGERVWIHNEDLNQVTEFSGKFTQVSRRLASSGVPTVSAGAREAQRIIDREIAGAVGGDMRFHGGKFKVGTRSRLVGGGTEPAVLVLASGQMQLIEWDTKGHWITPRTGTSGRGSRARRGTNLDRGRGGAGILKRRGGIMFPGLDRPRAYGYHHGTTGKHPFGHGRDKAERPVLKALRNGIIHDITAVF